MRLGAARVCTFAETNRAKRKQFRHQRGIVPTQSQPIKRTETKGFGAMTTAGKFDTTDSGARGLPARLRPADGRAPVTPSQVAGPFEVDPRQGSSMRDALITGLLVIYPAFAALAAIIAGLFLTGASGA
ncbi:hypothetical protein MesoLj131a_55360 [Mesorhizobium sp. 131-2-1]|nr:hypothetical protein MesoLj131a_55360 [Mesorhizobium sp. 131-2-1]